MHDPFADPQEARHELGVRLSGWDELPRADAMVAAVSHRELLALAVEDFQKKLVKGGSTHIGSVITATTQLDRV